MLIHNNGKDLAFLPDACAEVDPIYENCLRVYGSKKKMDELKLFCLLEGKEADNKLRYSIEITSNLLQFHQYIYILRIFFTIHITMTSLKRP